MKNKRTIFLLLILSFSMICTMYIVVDNDYFWHITAGKYMVSHHTILTKDIFSWVVVNKVWISHEWLFEVIIYTLSLISKHHIIIFSFINIFILLIILFLHNKNNYSKNTLFTLGWLLFYIMLNSNLISPRPQLISSWLLALTLYLLFDLKNNENSKKIYFLPLISLFWSNVHGGSSCLSYLLVTLFILIGFCSVDNHILKNDRLMRKQQQRLLIVLMMTIISIMINPHGIRMLIYPYENIMNYTMKKNIIEWRSTNLYEWYDIVYYVFILIIVILMLKSKKRVNLIDISLTLLFCYMGIRSVRFWNYGYIASTFFIFDYIQKRKDDPKTKEILLGTSITLIVIFCLTLTNTSQRINKTKYVSDRMIKKIKKEKPKKLFNLYDQGGYLINQNIKVFIDGRADLYTCYNYQDYLDISHDKANTTKLMDKYQFDYLLVNDDFDILKYLKNNHHYKIILTDGKNILYKRKDV